MKRIIERVTPPVMQQPTQRKRVAAYARVSSGKDAMLHSLSAQISYYSTFIQRHSEWQYAGVYADEATTGTKDARAEFQRMLADCRAGLIDMILTKSISRFARNTITLLETVRELKRLGIDVYFEEQKIHSMSGDGELMLTILASYAQEESYSASENQKWRVRRNFEDGKPWNCTMFGYRPHNGELVIQPDEAEVVRMMFADYLSGMGRVAIMKKLNAAGIPTRFGNRWGESSVMSVLQNVAYTGDLLLQTTYRVDHISKQSIANHGERPMYRVENSHAPIISREVFEAVQAEIKRRAEQHNCHAPTTERYPFSGLITCGVCGRHYRRKVTRTGAVWICAGFNQLGKEACASKQVPENTLMALTAEVLGIPAFDEEIFHQRISGLRVSGANRVIYLFRDGSEIEQAWQDRSRRESWTPEMRQRARERAILQRRCQ